MKKWSIGALGLAGAVAMTGAARWPIVEARAASASSGERAKVRARERAREVGGELKLLGSEGEVIALSPLKHTAIDAEVSGMVARVSVKQQFHNPSTSPVEAIYTFPLPHDAAVDAMRMTIGSRRIVGQIKKKDEARRIYTEAKKQGKKAGLLDQERPNIFTQSVANILPGEEITVEISYVQMLSYQDGSYEMSIPTVVGPRYTASGGYQAPLRRGAPSEPSSQGNSRERDADKITPPIVPAQVRAGHDISIRVSLDAGVPLGAVRSVLHPVTIQKSSPNRAVIQLQNQGELPNRDFILRFQTGGRALQTGLLAHAAPDGRGGWFSLILQPPQAPPPSEVAPKEMVFVIDQTGSQQGWPIAKAKQVMRYALRRLSPRDTFQLLGFNTEVYPCFPAPVQATPANVERALKYLQPIQGAGGTDIMKALAFALKIPSDPARPRIISYLTDGFVSNDMQVVDFIQKHRGAARLYPFGVGNSVNRFLIDAMAREGRGQAEYVTLDMSREESERQWDSEADDPALEARNQRRERARIEAREDAQSVAARFYKRIAQPVLLDVAVDWGGLKVEQAYPSAIPDVFAAQPIVIKGRYMAPGEGDVTIRGRFKGRPWQQKIHVVLPASNGAQGNSSLPSLWARARIDALQGSDWLGAQDGSPNPAIRDAIVQTALDYRLMSQWTSFVAVEQAVSNPGGQQETRDVPVEMPDSVSHEGIFGGEAPSGAPASATASATSGRYRVAQSSQFASRAGDPLISVEAPMDSKSVIAILPGGEIKKLQWNAKSGLWEARFDIPIYALAGEYKIRVLMVLPNGRRHSLGLSYRVDTQAPSGQGRLELASDKTLRLRMEAGDDTDRVEAILPWGERVDLAQGQSSAFEAKAQVPEAWGAKAGVVTYILTDRAHNRTRVLVDMAR